MELGDTRPELTGQARFSRKVAVVNARDASGLGFRARISSLQSLCFHHSARPPAWRQVPRVPNPDHVLPPLWQV